MTTDRSSSETLNILFNAPVRPALEELMGTRLRVGNIGLTTDIEKLTALFSEYGVVAKAEIALYELSGRSRGFGFVEMATEAEAASCITSLNGRDHEGRDLVVADAPPVGGRGRKGTKTLLTKAASKAKSPAKKTPIPAKPHSGSTR